VRQGGAVRFMVSPLRLSSGLRPRFAPALVPWP
jgi:hypothetical protein